MATLAGAEAAAAAPKGWVTPLVFAVAAALGGCRSSVACSNFFAEMKNKMLNDEPSNDKAQSSGEEKKQKGKKVTVPNSAEPGAVIEGPRRTREYNDEGQPARDYEKPHQGYERPHIHEWENGTREHPGRDYSPWPPHRRTDMNDWEALIESTIDAIHLDPSNKEVRIELTCAWQGGGKRIVAAGVDNFVANEMRLSNIVDQVTRFRGDEHEIEGRLFFLIRGREPCASDLQWPILKEKLALLRAGELSLLEIEPVYGATIIVLAKSFKIESR